MEPLETEVDIKWLSGRPPKTSPETIIGTNDEDHTDRALPTRVAFNPSDLYYDMTGEKLLLIFNHSTYQKTVYFHQRPTDRKYTEEDVKSLQNTFKINLGFKTEVHNNFRHEDIISEMMRVCSMDHRGTSCLAVAIMTHGDEDSVFASDRPYQLSDVIKLMQNNRELVGKPKLLFVQACRGDDMDDGRRVQTDGKEAGIVLPTHADTLITLASAEKHVAYRDSAGSWLMQGLCRVLDEHHDQLDLLQMITLVNQAVAYKSTYTHSDVSNNKKMMPETTFTLTKLLKL